MLTAQQVTNDHTLKALSLTLAKFTDLSRPFQRQRQPQSTIMHLSYRKWHIPRTRRVRATMTKLDRI